MIHKELRECLVMCTGPVSATELLQQPALLLFSDIPAKQELREVLTSKNKNPNCSILLKVKFNVL
jgi:hypothetical protein